MMTPALGPHQVLEEGGFDVLEERARPPRASRDARALLPHLFRV